MRTLLDFVMPRFLVDANIRDGDTGKSIGRSKLSDDSIAKHTKSDGFFLLVLVPLRQGVRTSAIVKLNSIHWGFLYFAWKSGRPQKASAA
jgi:hypothetical protein